MSRFRSTVSPTTLIAVLALFLAIGGTSYAAMQLSGSQIAVRSIPGNRLKTNSVTGKEIRAGSLGKVPRAKKADTATTAGVALTAGSAKTAATALTAGSAKTAGDAATLGGLDKTAFTQGGGQQVDSANTLVPGSSEIAILNIDQVGILRGSCDSVDKQPSLHLDNSGASSFDVSIAVRASNLGQEADFYPPIGGGPVIKASQQVWELQAGSATGFRARTIALRVTAFRRDNSCHFLINGTGDLGASIPSPA